MEMAPTAQPPERFARSAAAPQNASAVPALDRGLRVLELIAETSDGLTISQIHNRLGLGQAAVFRVTDALLHAEYLRRDPTTKRFTLTRKLLLLGQPRVAQRTLGECCIGAMRRVLEITSETVQLCCLADADCVVIEQLPSLHPFKYIVDIGSRPPAYCCAPGKALLAHLPDEEFARLVARMRFVRHTPRSILTSEALVNELARVRRLGYAVDRGEHLAGIHCVAAPVLDRNRRAVAAITIAGPAVRIPQRRFAEFGRMMIEAARESSREMEA